MCEAQKCSSVLTSTGEEMSLHVKQLLISFREGRSNAHIKGDYQRIGDILLKNIQGLRVTVFFSTITPRL